MQIAVVIVIYGFVMSCKKPKNVFTLVTDCFCAWALFWYFGKHLNNPLARAETVHYSSIYIILYLTHTYKHTYSINTPAATVMDSPPPRKLFCQFFLLIHSYIFYIYLTTISLRLSYPYCQCNWCWFKNAQLSSDWTALNCRKSHSVKVIQWRLLGAVSIRKTVLPAMANPMLKIRRPNGRLIFDMEIAIRR